jgi:hypothetical protein
MTNQQLLPEAIEKALIVGDLSPLTVEQRLSYVNRVCESVGLNPLTKPFDFLKTRDGKLMLYANKNAAEQLRKEHNISITIVAREKIDSLYIITARATLANGRQDESTAAVDLGALKGEMLANALMKCETKAKRRVTLSVVGLGMLDETEVNDNPQVFTKVEDEVAGIPHVLSDIVKPADDLPMPQSSSNSDQKLGFGKFRDKTWQEVPASYLEWLAGQEGKHRATAVQELSRRQSNDEPMPSAFDQDELPEWDVPNI